MKSTVKMKSSGEPPCEVSDDASEGREIVIKKPFLRIQFLSEMETVELEFEQSRKKLVSYLKCKNWFSWVVIREVKVGHKLTLRLKARLTSNR